MRILKSFDSCCRDPDQLDVRTATSVQMYDFSTLYTSIPHKLLKSQIASLVHNSFTKKDGSTRYTNRKLGQSKGYVINSINGGGEKMYTADKLCNMIDFLVDNIFVKFGGEVSISSSYPNPYGKLCSTAH